jgi:hypothetical protein
MVNLNVKDPSVIDVAEVTSWQTMEIAMLAETVDIRYLKRVKSKTPHYLYLSRLLKLLN